MDGSYPGILLSHTYPISGAPFPQYLQVSEHVSFTDISELSQSSPAERSVTPFPHVNKQSDEQGMDKIAGSHSSGDSTTPFMDTQVELTDIMKSRENRKILIIVL